MPKVKLSTVDFVSDLVSWSAWWLSFGNGRTVEKVVAAQIVPTGLMVPEFFQL